MIKEAKAWIIETFGQGAHEVLSTIYWSAAPLFTDLLFGGRWLFIVSAIAIAFWLYVAAAGTSAQRSLGGFLRYLFPRRIYTHPSAVLDYKYFVVNSLLMGHLPVAAWVGALVGLLYIADGTTHVLETLVGPGPRSAEITLLAGAGFTLCMALAMDLGKFAAHYLHHKIPALWELHKVHHSPEVLTPITGYRAHPSDLLLDLFLRSIMAGLVAGVYGYCYPVGLAEITILNFGAIEFAYLLTNLLRHSHIQLGYGRYASRWFISPLMHQIHHSSEARHLDKNFGFIFACWDFLAGTRYVPRAKEEFRLGLAGNTERFDSLGALYVQTFVNALRVLRRPHASEIRAARSNS